MNQDHNLNTLVLKKTEKLTTALYLVSEFISDADPMKIKIRERSLDLLSDMYVSPDEPFRDRSDRYFRTLTLIEEILSLIGIASSARMISEMNASVLRREYGQLRSAVESLDEVKAKISSAFPISDDFFSMENLGLESPKEATQSPAALPNHPYKGQNIQKDISRKGVFQEKNRENTKPKNTSTSSKVGSGKNSRRDEILKIVRKKGLVTVKDISEIISDCSEKTIQRELLSLVAENVLKKEGEKRWSKYSFV